MKLMRRAIVASIAAAIGGAIPCAYPFDAPPAEVTDSGVSPMTLTNGSQSMSAVLTGTTNHQFEAFPANMWTLRGTTGGNYFTPVNTVIGMELELVNFPKHSGGGSGYGTAYAINLAYLNFALNDRVYLTAEATDDGRAYPALRNAAGDWLWEGLGWVDDILRIGMYYDPVGDRWGIITRTVESAVETTTDHGYIAGLTGYGMTGDMYGLLEVVETTAAADTSGETFSVNVLTDPSDWQLPFLAGTQGVCSAIGVASCVNPLNASDAEADAFYGFDVSLLDLSGGDQTVSLVHEDSGIRTEAALTATRNVTAISYVPQFGAVVNPVSVSPRTGWGTLWFLTVSMTTSVSGNLDTAQFGFGVIEKSDGSYDVVKRSGDEAVIVNVASVPRIGVYANTLGFGVTVDGVDYGTVIDLNALAGEDLVEAGFRGLYMVDYGDVADVGITNTLRLITDASEMVPGDLPAGYTDQCGGAV